MWDLAGRPFSILGAGCWQGILSETHHKLMTSLTRHILLTHAHAISNLIDPRVTVGIPIIGCASYTTLITNRAKTSGIPLAAPYLPSHFLSTIAKLEAAAQPASRFSGKRILVLSGGSDKLVPAAYNEPFLEGLRTDGFGEDALRVRVFEGAGHEVVEGMVEEMERWVRIWLIKVNRTTGTKL